MSKTKEMVGMPMGVRFNSDLTLTENAEAAWDSQKTMRRTQSERNAKTLMRRVFRTDELEFSYFDFLPDTPTFTADDELVAFYDGQFQLLELCSNCGKEVRPHAFRDLAGFGRAIEIRDAELTFMCRDCLLEGHKRKTKQ